jgi:predicted nucleic acid-binding protein
MIVYVESNFVLELAFLQEEHESCEALLALAEGRAITLLIPNFSIGEPYEAWVRRAKGRGDLSARLRVELGELARSQPYRQPASDLLARADLLSRSVEEEKGRLDVALRRILGIATIIPLDAAAMQHAIELQASRNLSPQDSLVYASVHRHLMSTGDEPRCFVTRNSRDFTDPDTRRELTRYNCRLLIRFRDAVGFARSQIREGDA